MISKKVFSLIFITLFISFVSAQYWGYNYYFDLRNPETWLQNPLVQFFAVFLLIFAFVFISLNKTFGMKKDKNAPPWMASGGSENKGAVVVISLVIAFFVASVFVQRNWIDRYLGDLVGPWLFVLALVVIFILSIPFFKSLKQNIGTGGAIALLVIMFWGGLKFFVESSNIYSFNLPYDILNLLIFLSSVWFLIIAGVVGIFFMIIKRSGRK